MDKNKIALIGTSPIMQDHIVALKESGLKPIAIASSNPYSSSQVEFAIKNNIPKKNPDWKKLLDQEKYDGIVIATRIESTLEILEYAIKQNVPILVEKPISVNSNEIKKLIKKSHELIMVGYNRRFYHTVNTLKNFIHNENIPVIANMIIPESNIQKFFENSSHSVDLLRYIFGDIKIEFVKQLIQNETIKGLVATFSNEKNDLIQLVGSWNASDNFSLSVFCDKKKMELRPYETLKVYDGIKVIEPTKNDSIRKYIPSLVNEVSLESIDKKIKPGFFHQSTIFAELVKNRIKNKNAATLYDALKTIEICEKLVGKYSKLK